MNEFLFWQLFKDMCPYYTASCSRTLSIFVGKCRVCEVLLNHSGVGRTLVLPVQILIWLQIFLSCDFILSCLPPPLVYLAYGTINVVGFVCFLLGKHMCYLTTNQEMEWKPSIILGIYYFWKTPFVYICPNIASIVQVFIVILSVTSICF